MTARRTDVAVTFDFGQTVVELDTGFLAKRLGERGMQVPAAALAAGIQAGQVAYGAAKRRLKTSGSALGDAAHEAAWTAMMSAILEHAGVSRERAPAEARWLYGEQPRANLWRALIPGVAELAAELRRSLPVGVLSNSEGHLQALVDDLGLTDHFDVVIDSGVVGVAKPNPRIFELTAEHLGVSRERLVHIGDAWEADVLGALAVGARAILFGVPAPEPVPPNVGVCADAAELRSLLGAWGLLSATAPGTFAG